MPNEKLDKLLAMFRDSDFVKSLKESNINEWRLLLVEPTESIYSAKVPMSVDFIILIDDKNIDSKIIDEAKQKLVSMLNNIDNYFYTYAIHTPTSFKNNLLDSKLSNEDEIKQFLAKADSLDNIYLKLQGADKKKLTNPSSDHRSQSSPLKVGKWTSSDSTAGSNELTTALIQQYERQYLDALAKLSPEQLSIAVNSLAQKLNEKGVHVIINQPLSVTSKVQP